jgi:Tfp pilus assembly protein PilV
MKTNIKIFKFEFGQSFFELIVAIGMIGFVLLALVSLATLSVRNASFSRNQAEAARLGQDLVEWLRVERDSDWNNFVAKTTQSPLLCFRTANWSDTTIGQCNTSDMIKGLFYREAAFSYVDANGDTRNDTVEAIIRVYWTDGQGYHVVTNSIYYTDWRLSS